MAFTDKLTAIADAIRTKKGTTDSMTLEQMATEINSIVIPTFATQTKSLLEVTEEWQSVTPDAGYDGLTQVDVPPIPTGYVGSGVGRVSGTTITPTTSVQTAVASGKYTTGDVKVGAIPSNYIIPSGSQTITDNGTYDVKALASAIVNVSGGGGIANVTELYSNDSVAITYTSTSAGTAKSITGLTGLCTYPFIVVTVENTDTASGTMKFIRSSTIISNLNFAAGTASATRYGVQQYYNSSGTLTQTSSTAYGIWGYTISTSSGGTLTIRGRCSTSYYNSLTGTYKIKVIGIKL